MADFEIYGGTTCTPVTVDTALDPISPNPVENRVIVNALANVLKDVNNVINETVNLIGEYTPAEPFVPGKNLYDADAVTVGLLNYSNGTVDETNTSNKTSAFIEVEPGKTYALSNVPTSGDNKGKRILSTAYNWCMYREDYTRPSGMGGRNSGNPFTIPEGVKYLRFSMYHTAFDPDYIMFEECTQAEIDAGTVPSAYEPYKDPADHEGGEDKFVIHTECLPSGATGTPPIGLHTMPKSEGVLNAIKRARQLTDIKWTPPIDRPRICFPTSDTYSTSHGALYADVFKAGVEYTGMPYSGRHKPGEDTSIDAFATAVANANSIVGKETDSIGSIPVCYYGTICTGLTAYALAIPNVDSGYIANIPGMEKQFDLITDGVRHSLNGLELADLLVIAGHGAIITDIAYKNGEVEWVEISEATRQGSTNSSSRGGQYGGLCRRIMMTVDEFFTWFDGFAVYRYSYLDRIPYTPNPYVPMVDEGNRHPKLDFPVMPYEGNKSNYRTTSGAPSVKLIINHTGYTHLRVKCDGVNRNGGGPNGLYVLPTDSNEITVTCKKAEGRYTAYLCNSTETEMSVACTWYCRPAPAPIASVVDGKLTVTINMERDEYKPICYALDDEVNDNGYLYLLTNENMTTTKNESGFVYTFTSDWPDGATQFCVWFMSNEFGLMKKTTKDTEFVM